MRPSLTQPISLMHRPGFKFLFILLCTLLAGGNAWADAAAPQAAPPRLSLMAQLGRRLFYDAQLSGSRAMSCASCHSPAQHYGPPNDLAAQMGGLRLQTQGLRAVPSLEYLERSTGFSIGPENETAENVNINALAASARRSQRGDKIAGAAPAVHMVPQGGLFWDGRADTLQDQANGPMFSPFEMAAGDVPTLAEKLRQADYAGDFVALFGARILHDDAALVAKALFAVGRYQLEDPSFHPYNSKYDYYLAGKAALSAAERRGLKLFEDPLKGNCAACHLDKMSANGHPPLFTDHEFEALGVPRNRALAVNAKPDYYDLGLCGPLRTDLRNQPQYCGLFITPTLRGNAASVFSQRRVSRSARRTALLRQPRYRSGAGLPRTRWTRTKVRRPAPHLPGEYRYAGCAA